MSSEARGFSDVLRNRNFLRLWLAQAVSQVAQNGVNLVQIVLIEILTHSSGQIALMVLAFSLPGALLSIFAGVVVDRVSNRLILFTSNRRIMGQFVNPLWIKVLAWVAAGLIVVLNLKLLLDFTGLTG